MGKKIPITIRDNQEGKVCSGCKVWLTLDRFSYYTWKGRGYYQSHCKPCRNIANSKWRQTEKGIEYRRRQEQKRRDDSPEKVDAKNHIRTLKEQGIYPNASDLECVDCGCQAEEYHHYAGYEPEHWADVVPLCKQCHQGKGGRHDTGQIRRKTDKPPKRLK